MCMVPTHLQQGKPLHPCWWQEGHKPPTASAKSCNTQQQRGQHNHFILMKNFPLRVS